MIKSKQAEARPGDTMDDGKKSPASWNKDLQAQCLRVELGNGDFFVFPYAHLSFVKMGHEENRDILTISFTTHDIRVTGRNLRDLGIALQKLSADWLQASVGRYAILTADDAVFIESIDVSEAADSQLS